MIVRHPKNISKAVVCVTKLIHTASGIDDTRYGTGFLYRDADGALWLVSNWHVFTGRRPDEQGKLLGDSAQSPYAVSVGLPLIGENKCVVAEYPLYEGERPLWQQHKLGPLFDLAALPISPDPKFEIITIQDSATGQMGAVEPGFDLIIIGFPFQAGNDVPYPLWKRGLLASEPSRQMFGNPQVLIDTAGTPGMSGSPVFVSHHAFITTPEEIAAQARVDSGESTWMDEPELFGFERAKQTVELEWIGVYAGATENAKLDRLQLGRMYAASAVDELIADGVPGTNPFPPGEIN